MSSSIQARSSLTGESDGQWQSRVADAPRFFQLPQGNEKVASARRRHLTRYLRVLRLVDVAAIALGLAVAWVLAGSVAFSAAGAGVDAVPQHAALSVGLVVTWMLLLQLHNAYDGRLSGHGIQEYRRVLGASLHALAGLAIVAFALQLGFARVYVLLAVPAGGLALLAGRWFARTWLVRQRVRGEHHDRVLVVGSYGYARDLIEGLHRTPSAGFEVIGLCSDDAVPEGEDQELAVAHVGDESSVLLQAQKLGVDVIAVSSASGLGSAGLRRLGWALEGTDIDLVVAPGLLDVAAPRLMTRPVQGVPLLHVEAPQFDGARQVVKSVMDRTLGALLLALFSPVFAVLAILIKIEDRGPVLFAQERVGRHGESFKIWKFRSMVQNAEQLLPALMETNDGAGPLFKMKEDPRVTRIGRIIRKYSLDELPQLINVVTGDMSLVGPRPPLPREVAEYEPEAHRRLRVKPGMTGLWQISGRSDLSWHESVRLDLYYVENWTPLLDLMILWRTAKVVFDDARGAY